LPGRQLLQHLAGAALRFRWFGLPAAFAPSPPRAGGPFRPLGREVDDLRWDLPGFPVQPLALGVAGMDVAVEVAALGALAPTLHSGRRRSQMLRRLDLKAPVAMAPVIGPQIEAGLPISGIDLIGPLQAQARHIGRAGGDPDNLDLAILPFDLLADPVLVRDIAEPLRPQSAVGDQNMCVVVSVVASLTRHMQRHINRDGRTTCRGSTQPIK
jgi:hypothetical protein